MGQEHNIMVYTDCLLEQQLNSSHSSAFQRCSQFSQVGGHVALALWSGGVWVGFQLARLKLRFYLYYTSLAHWYQIMLSFITNP